MAYKIQHLGLGGILDQAIAITRDHFGLLFSIMLLLLVPFSILSGFVSVWALSDFLPQASIQDISPPNGAEVATPEFPLWFVPWSMLLVVLYLFVVCLTNAAVIHAVARLYLGQTITATEAIRHGLRRLLPLVGTTILTGLAIMGGFLLLFIPGILCIIWFGLIQHVVVIEEIAGSKALGRSKKLVGPHWATFVVLMLMVAVISYALQLTPNVIPQPYLRVIVASLITAVVTIITTAAWVVFYFSCRCALENFDLHHLAETIGASPVSANGLNQPGTT